MRRRRPPRTGPEASALYEEPAGDRKREVALWEDEQPRTSRAIVLGTPGGGKSFLTQTATVALARQPLEQLGRLESRNYLTLSLHIELGQLAQPGLPDDMSDALVGLLRERYGLSKRLEARVPRHAVPTDGSIGARFPRSRHLLSHLSPEPCR
jgi:hypothetical protein